MKPTTGQKKMSHGVTLGWQSNRSCWCLTLQVFFHRISSGLWCRGHVGLSRVIPLSDSHLLLSHYMWVHTGVHSRQSISDFIVWQSGVWATSWFWPPFSVPRRWGQQGMSWSGTWPCLTSVCVLSPCPWLWWERTRFNNLESKMQSYKWVISSQTYW